METRNSRLSETLDSKSTGSLMSQSFLPILPSVSETRKHSICIKYPPPKCFICFLSPFYPTKQVKGYLLKS